MKLLRVAIVVIAVVGLWISGRTGAVAYLPQQRDQIAVYILVNVTPAPVAYDSGASTPGGISLRMGMRGRGSALFTDVFEPVSNNIVAQNQVNVRVEAEVTPNPNATLLYSNVPEVVVNQTAGTTQTTPACVYTVTADTASTTLWSLDDGLSNDFANGWYGRSLANNTYLQGAAPQPTSTPFVVYPDNNSQWYKFASNQTGKKTYCVTLTLTIPVGIPQGAYSTNAIYTLFY